MAIINNAGFNPNPQINAGMANPNSFPGMSNTFSSTAIPQQLTPSSSIVWVQGEAGAKAYPVAPGNRIALFDAEAPVVYVKEVDLGGRPLEMEIYDLVKRESSEPESAPKVDLTPYITRDEIKDIVASSVAEEVEKAISEISLKPTSTKKKKEVDE